MEGTARIWFTPQQRAELWERWKTGQCVADIARALERRNKSGVYRSPSFVLVAPPEITQKETYREAARWSRRGNLIVAR
jgi:hypothetical protein